MLIKLDMLHLFYPETCHLISLLLFQFLLIARVHFNKRCLPQLNCDVQSIYIPCAVNSEDWFLEKRDSGMTEVESGKHQEEI